VSCATAANIARHNADISSFAKYFFIFMLSPRLARAGVGHLGSVKQMAEFQLLPKIPQNVDAPTLPQPLLRLQRRFALYLSDRDTSLGRINTAF
jgi:hypothetical protein